MSLARVMWLVQRGATPTQALDYVMVRDEGIPAEDWAAVRDVEPKSVRDCIADAATYVPEAADDAGDGEGADKDGTQYRLKE